MILDQTIKDKEQEIVITVIKTQKNWIDFEPSHKGKENNLLRFEDGFKFKCIVVKCFGLLINNIFW